MAERSNYTKLVERTNLAMTPYPKPNKKSLPLTTSFASAVMKGRTIKSTVLLIWFSVAFSFNLIKVFLVT